MGGSLTKIAINPIIQFLFSDFFMYAGLLLTHTRLKLQLRYIGHEFLFQLLQLLLHKR